MANASRTGEKEKGLGHEIAGIALLALALYVGVSVFSPLGGVQRGGVAGEFISGLVFTAFGYASCILPLLLLVIGFKLLLRRAITISVAAPVSIGVFMTAASALMAEVTGGSEAGGAAGEAIAAALTEYAGRTGSLIVLVSLLVLSVLAFSGISGKRRAKALGEDAPGRGVTPQAEEEDDEDDDGTQYKD